MKTEPITELRDSLKKQGVKYCVGAYVDIHGVPKGKFVPIDHFEDFAACSELYTGYALDGLGQNPNDDEINSVPDLERGCVLPWNREVACNPYLAAALVLAAGLEGIRENLDPGPAQEDNLYELSHDDPDRTAGTVFSHPVAQTSLNGVTGHPSRATAQQGKELFTSMTDALVKKSERPSPRTRRCRSNTGTICPESRMSDASRINRLKPIATARPSIRGRQNACWQTCRNSV